MNQAALKTGALLRGGTYRIDRVLGQGGFGITYLATDLSLDKHVAIKEFFPKDYCGRDATTSHVTLGTQSTSEFVERLKAKFLKEARNIAKFDHPNIIRIHAAFEENNTAYYVMDFIEGESLSDRVKRQGALPRAVALRYIYKVGAALKYVHSFRMNHLDVKPANIMVRTGNDSPILIDFGLSKQYDATGNQTSTTPIGISHGYAPMEQYNDGGVGEFSPTTDEYSLAATLYYLLSGITPPQSTKLIEDELTFPQSVPLDLIPPISKAMSSARKNRYPTIQQFIDAIKIAKTDTEGTAIREDEEKNTTAVGKEKDKNSNNTKRTNWIITGVGVIISIVSGLLFPAPWITSLLLNNNKEPLVIEDDSYDITGTINGHDYVDLGLSVKWATCNVGADNPSDYGDYFAWGETSTKTTYERENSVTSGKYMDDISGNPKYDVARANFGGPWRIPTKSECDELVDNCSWIWTTLHKHKGYRITSNVNGNSIFIPAAGNIWSTFPSYKDKTLFLTSSTPSMNDLNCAYFLYYNTFGHEIQKYDRCEGWTIRPVLD